MVSERRLMEIPRARQDPDIAGMANALGGIVGMLAAIVIDRFGA
jgi:hypothetical protein